VTSTVLPDWLAAPTAVIDTPRRRPHRFLRKSLGQVERLLATLSEPPGRLAGFDPRVKLVTALVVLLVLALVHDPRLLSIAAVVTVVGALAAGVGRTLAMIVAPISAVTALVMLPATSSLVRPGVIVVPLGTWVGRPWGLTAAGLTSWWLIVARVVASLAVVVVLTRTTSWLRLTAALRSIGAPGGFVLIATMAHRYLWVLGRSVVDALQARRARSIGGATGREDRAFIGGSVGALFLRSNELADQVHQAMVSRGFTGRLIDPAPGRLRGADLIWGLAVAAAAAALLWGDLLVR
jgi:cobalt/nickel transport system permease protein